MTDPAEIRLGYKQTEMGFIPEDWKASTIGEVATFNGGAQPPRSTFRYTPHKDYVRLIQIRDYKSEAFHTYIPVSLARKFCDHDDIMIGRYGPPVFQILRGIKGAYNVALIKVMPSGAVDREYLYYILKQDDLFELIDALSRRSSGQTGVEMSALRAFPLPLPPISEQRAIAASLADADRLIAALEGMIAKKRDLKQAAMQHLLTGKTRLPGFSGGWGVKRLGDHVRFLKNGTLSRAQLAIDAPVKYLHYGDIHGSPSLWLHPRLADMPCVDPEMVASLDRLEDGDLIFADASEDIDGVGKSIEITDCAETEVVSGLHTIAARFDKEILADGFKAYLQFVPPFRAHLRSMAAGTKVLATNRKHIGSATLALPEPLEQIAIAELLSDMDAELAALEAQAAKAEAVKQGMMQELLTGRVRLV